MVTGTDHVLFLLGVVFFLRQFKDILVYVSLFTIGHSLTLLGGVLGGFHANEYLVDAIIGLLVTRLDTRDRCILRACADDLGFMLKRLQTLSLLERLFRGVELATGLSLKFAKCHIVPLLDVPWDALRASVQQWLRDRCGVTM